MNNEAESLTLLYGLILTRNRGFGQLTMVEDSNMVIRHMHYRSIPRDLTLTKIIKRSREIIEGPRQIEFFHVLGSHNSLEDHQADETVDLAAATFTIKGWDPCFFHIP